MSSKKRKGKKSIPNVLPDGALKSISHNEFITAQINNDSMADKDISEINKNIKGNKNEV